ncbi:hypothetical protein ES703_17923 [subsurface metagenome]
MFNINTFEAIYRRTKRGAGVTGSLVRISLKPVGAKKLRVLTHVSCENQSASLTKIRLGIHNRGVDYYTDEIQTVAANELCVAKNDVLLGDGDRFFAEFTGALNDNVLILNAFGWEQTL